MCRSGPVEQLGVMQLDNALCKVQTLFLRKLAGKVRKSTSRLVLLQEFGVQPLCRVWLRDALCSWNRVVRLPASSLLSCALRENMALSYSYRVMASGANRSVKCLTQFSPQPNHQQGCYASLITSSL